MPARAWVSVYFQPCWFPAGTDTLSALPPLQSFENLFKLMLATKYLGHAEVRHGGLLLNTARLDRGTDVAWDLAAVGLVLRPFGLCAEILGA